MRRPAALTTALVVVAGAFALASPASADHIVTVTREGCGAGVFTGGFPDDVSTSRVTIRREGSTVHATCTFTGLPLEFYNEEVDLRWTRVTTLTTVPVTGCALSLEDGTAVSGEGTATFTAGGTARASCVFELPDA